MFKAFEITRKSSLDKGTEPNPTGSTNGSPLNQATSSPSQGRRGSFMNRFLKEQADGTSPRRKTSTPTLAPTSIVAGASAAAPPVLDLANDNAGSERPLDEVRSGAKIKAK